MKLAFDSELVANYHSGAQIARVLTENWVKKICIAQDVAIWLLNILKTTNL